MMCDLRERCGFGPVVGESPLVLILGSLPGEASIAAGSYYAHPRNAFWPTICSYFGEDVPESQEARCAFAADHRIALWDVLRSARRRGSLDSSIRAESANDVPALLARCPTIERMIFNGGTAHAMYIRSFGEPSLPYERLLSTSPAVAGRDAERRAAWHAALARALERPSDR